MGGAGLEVECGGALRFHKLHTILSSLLASCFQFKTGALSSFCLLPAACYHGGLSSGTITPNKPFLLYDAFITALEKSPTDKLKPDL